MGTYHEMRLLQPGTYIIEVAYDNAFLCTTPSDELTEAGTIAKATKVRKKLIIYLYLGD